MLTLRRGRFSESAGRSAAVRKRRSQGSICDHFVTRTRSKPAHGGRETVFAKLKRGIPGQP